MAQSNGDDMERILQNLINDVGLVRHSIDSGLREPTKGFAMIEGLKEQAKQLILAYRKQHELDAKQQEVERLVDVGGEHIAVRAWASKYREERIAALKAEREAL